MTIISDENLKSSSNLTLAPMIDFLFLMLAIFATLAVTKVSLFDTKLSLVQLRAEQNASKVYQKNNIYQINLSISHEGLYKWITEINHYPMDSVKEIQKEIVQQYEHGYIPKEKEKTQILIHIDKNAPWNSVAKLIFSIRELGFEAYPVYQSKQL